MMWVIWCNAAHWWPINCNFRFSLYYIRKITSCRSTRLLFYCNAPLAGLPARTVKPLKMVQNAATCQLKRRLMSFHFSSLSLSLLCSHGTHLPEFPHSGSWASTFHYNLQMNLNPNSSLVWSLNLSSKKDLPLLLKVLTLYSLSLSLSVSSIYPPTPPSRVHHHYHHRGKIQTLVINRK